MILPAFCISARIPKGLQFERWRHIHGCGRFFNAVRDSVSDKFLTVYKAGEPRPNVEQLAVTGQLRRGAGRRTSNETRAPRQESGGISQ